MEALLIFLSKIISITPFLDASIRERVTIAHFKKGQIIAISGRKVNEIWYVVTGLAKEYHYEASGRSVITTFWKENELMLVADSFFLKTSSDRYIQLIEDSILLSMECKPAQQLLTEFPELHSIQYSILSQSKWKSEDRSSLMVLNGKERYKVFCEKFPYGRISVADAASYLGLTRGGLCKVRAKR